MEANGLFLGIDIDEEISQVCYYDVEKRSVQTVYKSGDDPNFLNSLCLSDILKDKETSYRAIQHLLGALINAAKIQTDLNVISAICICLHDYRDEVREVFHRALALLGIPRDRYTLLGEEETFAFYAFSSEPALVAQGTVLYNFKDTELTACFLTRVNYKGTTVLREVNDVTSSDLLRAVAGKERTLDDAGDELLDFFDRTLKENQVSSVYLTGRGFDEENIPRPLLLKLGTGGHRIFVGQNLFVKGACICALAMKVPMADPFRSAGIFRNVSLSEHGTMSGGGRFSMCIMACRNRITSSIAVKTYTNGSSGWHILVRPGTNIDEASAELECLLSDDNYILFEIEPLGAPKRIEAFELAGFPRRDSKTTRIKLWMSFVDEDTLKITARDIGFGEEEKATLAEVSETFDLRPGEYRPYSGIKTKGIILSGSHRAMSPYIFPDTGRSIYTAEELVHYLYNNIYLIKKDFINADFIKFLEVELGNEDLAQKMKNLVEKDAGLGLMLLTLFKEVDYYSNEEIKIIEPVIDSIETANPSLRKFSVAAVYIKNGCISNALNLLNDIDLENREDILPESFYAKVVHGIGVCKARLFRYEEAAEYFEKAYEEGQFEESRMMALRARQLSGTAPGVNYTNLEFEDIKEEIDFIRKKEMDEISRLKLSTDEKLERAKEDYIIAHSL